MNKQQLQQISFKYNISNDDWAKGTGYSYTWCSQMIHGTKPLTRKFTGKCRAYLDRVCIPYTELAEGESPDTNTQNHIDPPNVVDYDAKDSMSAYSKRLAELALYELNGDGEFSIRLDKDGHRVCVEVTVRED